MLSVKMLGGLTFVSEGHRIRADLGLCGRLLAAYLFEFPGRVHRRERLAELFWIDLDAEHSRAALNTALWRVRKLLANEHTGDSASNLYTTAFEVVFEPQDWLCVDTHCFDRAAQRALGPGTLQCVPSSAQALEEAANGYSGSFLDGSNSDWIIAERERLHSLYVRCLSELIRVHVSDGQFELAISAARRILAADAFRESIQRALALLLVLNGQRAQAIRELRRCATDIKREIGVAPMPETSKLENSIVTGKIFDELPELTRCYFTMQTCR